MNVRALEEGRVAGGRLFRDSTENQIPKGIAFHGTSSFAACGILRNGFKPLSSLIDDSTKSILLELCGTHAKARQAELAEQLHGINSVNFFPISVLALAHTEQRGGQGLCTRILPVLSAIQQANGIDKQSHNWLKLEAFLLWIDRMRTSNAVVIAVNLQNDENKLTWNPQGVYQCQEPISKDRIIEVLKVGPFSNYDSINRGYWLTEAQKLPNIPDHFAHRVRDRTLRKLFRPEQKPLDITVGWEPKD
jgi:hypothetical protein